MSEDTVYYYLDRKYYQRSHWHWLFGHLMQYKGKILLVSFLTLITIALQTYIPLIFGQAIDTVIPDGDLPGLQDLAILVIILGLIRALIGYLASIFNEQISQETEMNVRVEFFENVSRKKMDFFNKARVGDLMSQATQDTQNLTFAISPGIRSIISAVFGIIAAAIAMLTLNVTLTATFGLIFPFYIYFMYTYAKRLQPVSLDRQQRLAKINTGLQENLTGIRVVRTFSAQEREAQQFESQVRSYEDVLVERGAISAYYIPILLLSLLTSLIFLLGVYIIEANEQGLSSLPVLGLNIPIQPLSVGDLIAFLTLMGILVFPTQILRFLLDVITLGFAGSSRIYTTLTTQSILEKGADLPLENIKGDITFTNVTFAYEEGARPAVIDLSFDLKAGETLAVIGPTGSGKTTIGKLLLRLYDIDEGSISIDSLEVNQIEINHLRSQVGMIEQDIMLFSASIRANIAYGVPNLTDEEIEAAAKAAQAHDFIMSFPDGYDTIIGEKGVTLSGGQRQRVAMARTFVTNPKILVMDDSTSAIDAQTEAKISAAMEGLLKNRTTIIITHRLATLKNADKILFLRNGTAEKIGTHQELIAPFEPYRQIFGAYQELPPLEVDN